MTKIKLEFESSEEVEKVVVDVKYVKNNKVVSTTVIDKDSETSNQSITKNTKVENSHGFDVDMMDIVNS